MPKDHRTLKAGQYQDVSGLTPSEDIEREEDGPLHYGDYLIRDEKDGVSVWDRRGNFIQTADTRSDAISDIDSMSVESEKASLQSRRDPRGKDIAWDGYGY